MNKSKPNLSHYEAIKRKYPDTADTDKVYGFFGPYFFLSNSFIDDIEYQGITYPSIEHAFQASKCPDIETRELFSTKAEKVLDAKGARDLGRNVFTRETWVDHQHEIMKELLTIKFSKGRMVRWMKGTLNKPLIYANFYGDTYWGVDIKTGSGFNHLGEILMEVRSHMKAIGLI